MDITNEYTKISSCYRGLPLEPLSPVVFVVMVGAQEHVIGGVFSNILITPLPSSSHTAKPVVASVRELKVGGFGATAPLAFPAVF